MDASTAWTVSNAQRARNTPGGKRIHYSDFFLTINTNIRPTSPAQATFLGKVMEVTMSHMFQEDAFKPAVKVTPGTHILDANIGPWSVELGPDQQRVHAHAFMKFEHDGVMQLSPEGLRSVFLSLWPKDPNIPPLKNVYVDIKWVKATDKLIAAYLSKQNA